MHQVLILGGGFAGVRTALQLAKLHPTNTQITLISDRPHFEYHAALYRVVTGKSPLEVCIPLLEIFDRTPVELVIDTVTAVDLKRRQVALASGASRSFETLVLALGSEPSYFHIPGLQEHSFGFKSIDEALTLKRHLHQLLEASHRHHQTKPIHIEVVGAGASGIELVGELAVYLRRLAKQHQVPPQSIKLDLIEAAPRIAPLLPEDMAHKLAQRLRHLGVNILTGKTVTEQDAQVLTLKDQQIESRTVIWTAGVQSHHLVYEITGLPLDPRGRVLVDDTLQAHRLTHVYALGDLAVTKYGGMAQTALDQAEVVARNIAHQITSQPLETYTPRMPVYALPAGAGWAAVLDGERRRYGRLGWLKRRQLDWQFFRLILPRQQAWAVYQSGKHLSEQCPICSQHAAAA